MLALDGRVMPIDEARDFLRSGVKAFIRPDADSKAFEGGIYDAETFAGVDSTPVLVASAVPIEAEWRFFIVDGEVVGCSEYRRWGRVSTQGSVPHAAIDLGMPCRSTGWCER